MTARECNRITGSKVFGSLTHLASPVVRIHQHRRSDFLGVIRNQVQLVMRLGHTKQHEMQG